MLIFYGDGIAYDRVLEDGVTLAPRAILPWPEEDTGHVDCRCWESEHETEKEKV